MPHDAYLIGWLMDTYPWGTYRLNARLGVPDPELMARIPQPYRQAWASNLTFRADALVILPEEVHIVECVIRSGEWWRIQQLDTYEILFRATEVYREHWEKPIRKILLTPLTNPIMETQAAARGIRVVKYWRPELEQYLMSLAPRHRIPRGSGMKVPAGT